MAWWLNKLATFMAFAGCVAMVESAHAEGPLPPDWLAGVLNEKGQHCEKQAERQDGSKLLLACGAAGVWEVALGEVAPRFVRSYDFAGDVVGFMTESDGRLWVKLKVMEARPFSGSSASTADSGAAFPDPALDNAPAPLPQPPVAKPPIAQPTIVAPTPEAKKFGRVTSSHAGEVVVSIGTVDRVGRGDHIELAVERSANADADTAALSRETVAVGIVTNVSEHSARVQVGLNEEVPVGALALPTSARATASLSAPSRVTKLWDVQLTARPFAALVASTFRRSRSAQR